MQEIGLVKYFYKSYNNSMPTFLYSRSIWAIYPTSKDELSSFKLSANISQRFRTAMLITNWLKVYFIYFDVALDVLIFTISFRHYIQPSVFKEETEVFPLFSSRRDFWEAVSNDESRSWIANLICKDENTDNSSLIQTNMVVENKLTFKPRGRPVLYPKPTLLSMETPNLEDDVRFEQKRTDLVNLLSSVDSKKSEIKKKHSSVVQIKTKIYELKSRLNDNEDRLMVLLENPEAGKQKLLDFIDKSDARLVELEMEWSEASKNMEDSLRKIRREKTGIVTTLRSKISHNMDCVESLQKEMELQLALEQKLIAHLKQFHEPKLNRSGITRRIMEMTASIRKQHDEIDRRELKWLSQTLDRTFTIIEETLYKDTINHKGERAYKLFARAHTLCMDAIAAIEKNGIITRQTEKLIDLIELEKQKKVESQLERIIKDLHDVEEENKRLTALVNG
uniref:Coiled-coil domain-containing protein 22 homolog n=1 Tax=Heterorhabditis bacteriophora TaxID=37862 RepID=A0A1I7XSS5_HETBA